MGFVDKVAFKNARAISILEIRLDGQFFLVTLKKLVPSCGLQAPGPYLINTPLLQQACWGRVNIHPFHDIS